MRRLGLAYNEQALLAPQILAEIFRPMRCSSVSIQICSFVAPCRRPILIATPLHQSLTWCTSCSLDTCRANLPGAETLVAEHASFATFCLNSSLRFLLDLLSLVRPTVIPERQTPPPDRRAIFLD